MSNVMSFEFKNMYRIHVAIDNDIWFSVKDIAKLLNIKDIEYLILEKTLKFKIIEDVIYLSRYDTFQLILLDSDTPSEIKNWVFHTMNFGTDSEFQNKLKIASDMIEQLNNIKAKIEIYDTIVNNNKMYSIEEVAKLFSNHYEVTISRNQLLDLLRKKKLLTLKNMPQQKYINAGYLQYKYNITNNKSYSSSTLITSKGINYLIGLLKTEGLIPLIWNDPINNYK